MKYTFLQKMTAKINLRRIKHQPSPILGTTKEGWVLMPLGEDIHAFDSETGHIMARHQ